jgi:hypothetical protein
MLQIKYMDRKERISSKHFNEMVKYLPRKRIKNNAFLLGEPQEYGIDTFNTYGALYYLYFTDNGKYYYGGLASTHDFDKWTVPI